MGLLPEELPGFLVWLLPPACGTYGSIHSCRQVRGRSPLAQASALRIPPGAAGEAQDSKSSFYSLPPGLYRFGLIDARAGE